MARLPGTDDADPATVAVLKDTGGTTTEQPVFNFAVVKGVAS